MNSDNNQERRSTPVAGRITAGAVLILAGGFIMLRNVGVFNPFLNQVIFTWQMILIAIGLVVATSSTNRTPGIIIMAVGALFLLPGLLHNFFRSYHLIWPALIITAGVILIYSGRRFPGSFFSKSTANSSEDTMDIVNIFSGSERQVVTDNFSGGKITSVFGGSEIDLTKSRLAPGVSVLEVSCVFGGTEIVIPADWNVVLDITPVLGGFSDSRRIIKHEEGTGKDSTLIIRGAVVFGGGELKSY